MEDQEDRFVNDEEVDRSNGAGMTDGSGPADRQDAPEPEADASASGQRSAIRFPYGDLDDAVDVAVALYTHFGSGGCTPRELAPHLNTTDTSSSFKTKVATAKTFGALGSGRSRLELTDLGHRLADPSTADDARAEAFLAVPLYAALFDRYQGRTLPGDAGLENEMRHLGVTGTVVGRARQTFQRSAQQAGFFHLGTSKLVKPTTLRSASEVTNEPPPTEPRREVDMGIYQGIAEHPILVGLWKMVPNPDDERASQTFDSVRRKRWLDAVNANFDLLFGPIDEPKSDSGNRTPPA